jgi:hypothetical protein
MKLSRYIVLHEGVVAKFAWTVIDAEDGGPALWQNNAKVGKVPPRFRTAALVIAAADQLVSEQFDLRPGAFRKELNLHRPIFQKTAAYGHFGREDADFTWERTDRVDALRSAAGLASSDNEASVGASVSS